jgi:hypothetical protein
LNNLSFRNNTLYGILFGRAVLYRVLFVFVPIAIFLPLDLPGQEVFFFRDSNNPGYYDTGLAFKTSPSSIEQTGPSGDKIPTSNTAYLGSNSLRIKWASRTGGDWSALVIAPGWPFQNITATDTLSFWAYSPEGLLKAHWPLVFMEGAPGVTKSRKYPLSDYAGDLAPGTWTQVKVPLRVFFNDPSQTPILFSQVKAIIFGQGSADGQEHTLLIDEVKTFRASTQGSGMTPPPSLSATGYDRHIELRWPSVAAQPASWRIYRSADNGASFTPIKNLNGADTVAIDFHKTVGSQTFQYRVVAVNASGAESAPSPTASAALTPMNDEQLLDMVQRYTFRYFWDFAHPVSGLSRERNSSANVVTIGGSGFGVMAILVGMERGWITREQGLARLHKIVAFLEKANRFKGVYPHWMDGNTGSVIPFSTQDNGGDLVETAFLFQGLLTVRAYCDRNNAEEELLRAKITTLWRDVDWNWHRQQNQNVLYWHWSPNFQFAMNFPLKGWNETMIAYLLGIASPTYPIPASLWHTGWANNGAIRNGNQYFGITLPLGTNLGGPLFFTHYSFMGFDPRGKKDAYVNYFEQNRNQSLLNRAYCIANPRQHVGYGANCWGLTASDDPLVGYFAHEPQSNRDNGTVSPTGALSSMPYTPEESMAALKYFYRELGASLWGPLGFYDAFNLSLNWYADSYLAIDQGPIIGMIENHRSSLLWKNFMKNPEIEEALGKIGFTPTATPLRERAARLATSLYPNPVSDRANLQVHLESAGQLDIRLFDLQGRPVHSWPSQSGYFPAGPHSLSLAFAGVPPGAYALQVRAEGRQHTLTLILQP